MKKTVDEYMKLPYAVELIPDDGSFFAKVKELDGCMTVGDNPSEALEMLEDAKLEWFYAALEDGVEVPLPESMRTAKCSGKFALRMSTTLHQKLTEGADQDGVSLNQYIVSLLAERNSLAEVRRMLVTQMASVKPVEQQEVEPSSWGGTSKVKSCKVLPFERRKQQVVVQVASR